MELPSSFCLNPSAKDRAELRKQQSIDRFYQVSNLVYLIEITFQKFAATYTVRTQINFDYNPSANPKNHLKIEYSGKYLNSLSVNDQNFSHKQITDTIWRDNFLEIPSQNLIPGRNILHICTKNEFSTDGTGLFSYQEGVHQYIYSLMVANHCQKIFPCFDQPNLKALFYLQIVAPAKWLCVSNEPPSHVFEVSKEEKRWVFEPKAKISTYLLAIIAGDYKAFDCAADKCFNKIPLRLLVKQKSFIEKEQNVQEIFELTNFGLEFYTQYFQVPFPFSKYDQIFCPEFNFLGMENPGAVCLTDSYLFWDIVTACKRTARCLTILHELAHMWFGNLVTMKWWDDIWLNESFAVYISHFCLEKMKTSNKELAALYSDSMVRFFFYKRDGYEDDSVVETTHPICQAIQSTEQSSEIFNSITYSKGAAVIKQMVFMIGEHVFSKSLSQYFEKFRWNNADLNDFIDVIQSNLEEKHAQNIKVWKTEWLQWASLNVMSIEDEIKEKNMLKIIQKPVSQTFPHLRVHYFKVCVYYKLNEQIFEEIREVIVRESCLEVGFSLKKGVSEYGVLLNFEDHGYFKTSFDENSMNFFKNNLLFIENKLSRALILLNFFDLVFENEDFSAFEFLKLIKTMISHENDIQMLNQCLNYASRIIENYLPETLKPKGASPIFSLLYEFLQEKSTNSEKLLVVKEFIGLFAKSQEDIGKLVSWLLQKNQEIKHIRVNSYMLTHTIELIFMRKLATEEERHDLMERFIENNKYYKLFCEHCLMKFEEKSKAFEKFLDPSSTEASVYLISFAMKGFNNEWDMESAPVFERKFFENVEKVFEKCNVQYSKTFFKKLFPRNENLRKQIESVENILKKKIDEVLMGLLKAKLQYLRQKLNVFNKELRLVGLGEV